MQTRCSKCRTDFSFEGRCPYCGRPLTHRRDSVPTLHPAIAACVVVLVVSGVVCFLLHSSFLKIYWSKFRGSLAQGVYEVGIAPPAEKAAVALKPELSLEDCRQIRNLLTNKRFDVLSRMAIDIQQSFQSDPSYEYKLNDFFNVFADPVPAYEVLLDEWVRFAPSYFAPYLARAEFYSRMAWESRGHKYASETSDEQFNNMHLFFGKASKDLDIALSINPNLLPAYLIRIGIHMAEGSDWQTAAVFIDGKSRFPSSSLLYSHMLNARLPRWGGSYAEMEKIAMEGYEHVSANPALYSLFGQIYADQAWILRQEKKYNEAIALFTKAIAYGDNCRFLEGRARAYIDLKDFDKALEDINRSIEVRPLTPVLYNVKATALNLKGDLNGAVESIRFLEAQFPGDPHAKEWRSWAAQNLLYEGHGVFKQDLDQAAAKYTLAIEVNPDCGEAFYWRGVAYSKLNKTDQACSDLERAIRLNPRHFESYRMLDYLLVSRQKWDEIIEHWNGYLTLEPQSADAYLERAGTYKHKGDMKSALADLRSACNLGKEEACKILKRYPE